MDRNRPPRRCGVALVSALLAAASCGDPGEGASPRPCPSPSPVAARALPERVPLGMWGTITEVSRRAGFIGAEAVTERQIVIIYPEIVRTMRDNGYTLLGGENEGFEAELTWADPRGRLTTFTLRQGRCEQVIVRTLIETTKEHE